MGDKDKSKGGKKAKAPAERLKEDRTAEHHAAVATNAGLSQPTAAGLPVQPADRSAIMQYFSYDHLPEGIARNTSKTVAALAEAMEAELPMSAEKSAGLRKLLEAKDCFVRAALNS